MQFYWNKYFLIIDMTRMKLLSATFSSGRGGYLFVRAATVPFVY
jgi:hypothetical protein